jgi:radical SAM superfamily enzyme YgiQ (UPF0313 family)
MKKTILLFFPSPHPEGSYANYPWALLYLERMVRHLDVNLVLLDERLDKNYKDIIEEHKNDLLFVGISAILGYQVVGGKKFSELVKSIAGVPIIWGGWFPTIFPEMILNDNTAEYICVGQGELPFQAFTETMLAGEDVSVIPGIGYKKNGEIIINPNSNLINTNSFPLIDLTLIDANRLIDLNGVVEPGNRMTEYIATTGCPHNCSFCNLTEVVGSKWFAKPINEIIENLKYFYEKAGVSHVVFIDDNFLANKKFIKDFCNEIIQSGISFTWEAHAHVGYFLRHFVDEDIRLLYSAGCRRIIVGAESGDQEVLDLLNKRTKAEDNLTIIKLLKKHNIRVRMHTMICFPANPNKDFFLTLNMIGKALIIDPTVQANIKFYKPIPKTALFKICVDHGFIQPTSIDELIDSFSRYIMAPWYKRNYHKDLDNYVNFYFLFLNPFYFMKSPWLSRPFIFLLNMVLTPLIYLRFKFNLMRFPIEAILLRSMIRKGKMSTFLDSVSVNKTKLFNKARRIEP